LAARPGPSPPPTKRSRAIGSAREVVSRRLAAFARRGAVGLGRGEIAILDESVLRAIKDAAAPA